MIDQTINNNLRTYTPTKDTAKIKNITIRTSEDELVILMFALGFEVGNRELSPTDQEARTALCDKLSTWRGTLQHKRMFKARKNKEANNNGNTKPTTTNTAEQASSQVPAGQDRIDALEQ